MFSDHVYKTVLVLCTISVLSAYPLPGDTKAETIRSVSEIYSKTEEIFTSSVGRHHREKRQLNSLFWNNDFVQSLSRTFTDTVRRLTDAVNTGAIADSPLIRMVNDFGTRLGPVILRTLYTTAMQNVWNQIRDQARSSVNEFFDKLGPTTAAP